MDTAKLEARLKPTTRYGNMQFFNRTEYVKYEWRTVPDGYEDQARMNELLEVRPAVTAETPTADALLADMLGDEKPSADALLEEMLKDPDQVKTDESAGNETPSAEKPKTSRSRSAKKDK